MRKNRVIGLGTPLLSALSLMVLAACSSTSSAPASDADNGANSNADTDAVLVVGSEGEIPSLDPHSINGTLGLRVTDAIYETLVREDLQTETKKAPEVQPALASGWEVSDDGLTYTFTIRDDVSFHDGTPLDAEAVEINFDRLLDESSPLYSDVASANMSFITMWIKDTEVIDEHTFAIRLEDRFAELPRLLTDRRMAIISPAALETHGEDAIGQKPVGTGPFTIDSVSQGEQIELTRNDDYWRGSPELAGLVFVTIQDPSTMAAALQTGEVDAILSAGAEQVSVLESDANVIVQYPDPANQYFLRLNAKAAPTDNREFRAALNYAVDREGIAAALNEQALPVLGPVPQGSEAWNEDEQPEYAFDQDKARELLDRSGVQLPATVEVMAPSSGPGFSQASEIMSLVQQDLAAVDVELKVEYVEFTSMLEIEGPGYEDDVNGSFNGWTTGADSAYWLERMFSPDQVPPTGVNRGWYVNSELGPLFREARETLDDAERGAAYRSAAETISADAPWIFLYQNRLPRIFAANVEGIYETPSVFIDYATVSKAG